MRKTSNVSIELPLSNRVKKFLVVKYNHDGKCYLSNVHHIGLFLHTLIRTRGVGKPIRSHDTHFQIFISRHNDPDKKWIITESQVKVFERYVDDILKIDFMQYVSFNAIGNKIHVDKLIRSYKEIFELDEKDWSFDAMKRYYYRNCSTNDLNITERK